MKLLLPLYVFTIALLKYYYMFNSDNTLHKVPRYNIITPVAFRESLIGSWQWWLANAMEQDIQN